MARSYWLVNSNRSRVKRFIVNTKNKDVMIPTLRFENGGNLSTIQAKTITYTKEYYPLDSAEIHLSDWQIDKWVKEKPSLYKEKI